MKFLMLLSASCLLFLLSCGQTDWRDMPERNLSVHHASLDKPLIQRITALEAPVIAYLEAMDSTRNYGNHQASPEEQKLLEDYLRLLPPKMVSLMEEKVAAIHLVENFKGGGMADMVFDKDRNFWIVLYFNPAIFRTNLSDWIKSRDTLPFSPVDGVSIDVACSGNWKGLLHTLVHESAHILDYYRHVTPWTEDWQKTDDSPRSTPFTKGIWDDYSTPGKFYGFLKESGYSGYGMKGTISADKALGLYRRLADSPFASLYGAGCWAEDFAETWTWWYLEKTLGVKYQVIVSAAGLGELQFSPGNSDTARARHPLLETLLAD